MTVLAASIAAYGALVMVWPGFGAEFVGAHRALTPWALSAHLAGGVTALLIGPWQLNRRVRQARYARHRWLGRTYIVAILVGGAGGLVLAPRAQGGLVTAWGFGVLAVAWIGSALRAYVAARGRDFTTHRAWMERSFALTLAAVTLRIYLPLAQVAGIPFSVAYPAIAWLCWVPNLVVAELVIRLRQRGRIAAPQSTAASVGME